MIELLQELISTQSYSRQESATADILERVLHEHGIEPLRYGNNVLAFPVESTGKPRILLNSHHDTVRPGNGWTRDPFAATVADGKLYGLGSNDAGGALVMMLAAFLHFANRSDLPFEFVFAGTAEEEVSGSNGMALLTRELWTEKPLALAIVGEPTEMQLAIAEKGLMVLDCVAHGRTGHAARNEGDNAITKAIKDLDWFHTFQFERVSASLGEVKMTVTQISAGSQHNVVPDRCEFVVDTRITDSYTNQEVLDIIRQHVQCDVTPRSMRLAPSSIPIGHPLVQAGLELGLTTYGSPTMSDQSLLPEGVPSLKIGPGHSSRSHTPDEWIGVEEVERSIPLFINLLETMSRRVA